MGRKQDIERNAISIGTRQMRYGKEKRKRDSTVGPDMDSLFLAQTQQQAADTLELAQTMRLTTRRVQSGSIFIQAAKRPTVDALDGGEGGISNQRDKKSLPFVFHLRRAYRTFVHWNILINTVTSNLLWLAVFAWLRFLVGGNLLWCLLLHIL